MLDTFTATLNPMLTLFLCIAIGYILRKTNVIGDEAGKVIAKLETAVFCVALNISSMAKNFTIERIAPNLVNIGLACLLLSLCVVLSVVLARVFTKEDNYERKVYTYAFAFANYGYVGDPLVAMTFGGYDSTAFFYYKVMTIPIGIVCLTWGVSKLITSGRSALDKLKGVFSPPMIGMLIGMVIGVTGLGNVMYNSQSCAFITTTLDNLGSCMGPCAMLLAGITVARFSLTNMLKEKKVYVASLLRLIVLPAVLLGAMFGVIQIINLIFSTNLDNSILYLMFFVVAMPFGMNTIVYPEAYGKDPSKGASMTLISHTLCVLTIPLMFALFCLIFGQTLPF